LSKPEARGPEDKEGHWGGAPVDRFQQSARRNGRIGRRVWIDAFEINLMRRATCANANTALV
jgi:hypothetical protein